MPGSNELYRDLMVDMTRNELSTVRNCAGKCHELKRQLHQ